MLGGLQAYAARHAMNADGISYLDLSDRFAHGDWQGGVNALWSPLYPLVLGVTLRILRPSAYWEFAAAHLVNFFCYLLALAAFEYLLSGILRLSDTPDGEDVAGGSPPARRLPLPERSLIVVGFALFIWAMLVLVGLVLVTPDLLFTALLFAATGVLLRRIEKGGRAHLSGFALLGALLGLGYLAKAPMLALAPLFIIIAVIRAGGTWRQATLRALVASTILLCVIAPFVLTLSHAEHRLTFGASARLNYLWHVNRIPSLHGQSGLLPHESSVPLHPTRRIFAAPAAYEFAASVDATYPPWFDPAYWYQGITPHFNLQQQLAAVRLNLSRYLDYFGLFGALPLGLMLLYCFYLSFNLRRLKQVRRELRYYTVLLVLSIAGLCLYVPIHLEHRYVAPFVVIFHLTLIASIRLPASPAVKRFIHAATALVIALFIVATLFGQKRLASRAASWRQIVRQDVQQGARVTADVRHAHARWHIADRLQQMNLAPGDRVATIGESRYAYWARLGKWRIVAEVPNFDYDGGRVVPNAQRFWEADEKVRARVLGALAASGARAVICDDVPSGVRSDTLEGWQQVTEQPNCYVYFLIFNFNALND